MTEGHAGAPSGPGEENVTRAGTPVPSFGHVLHAVGPWMTTTVITAVVSGAICALLLNRAYGAVVSDASTIGWMATMAAIGAHPTVVAVLAITLFGGVAIASFGERLTSAPIVGAMLVVGVSAIPWTLGITSGEAAEFGGLGVIDPLQSQLAAANLPSEWWLLGLWFGLTWMAGRHNLGVFVAAVWIVSLYTTWQLSEARVDIWSDAVAQVYDSLPSQARTLESEDDFLKAAWLIHTRVAADLFYFLTPMLAIGMLRRRRVSTLAADRDRLKP